MERIFELRIDEEDELSGIDSISLVDEPAIEVNWIAFNKEKEEFHIPEGEDQIYFEKLAAIAQDETELLDNGWEIDDVYYFGKEGFATNPNRDSEWDESLYRIRYKYMLRPEIKERAVIDTTRDFCKDLINKNYVWRVEEMDSLVNDFGSPAIVWRGGYNCRHIWAKIRYKKTGDITNKASANKNKATIGDFPISSLMPELDIIGYPQPSTITNPTLVAVQEGRAAPSTARNLGLSKEKFSYPLFEDKESAEAMAVIYGCTGSHEHMIGDKTYYMPCEKHPEDLGYDNTLPPFVDEVPRKKKKKSEEFESYSDYPDSVKNNAKAVLKWVDENGWGSCGTDVGKQRANQLANGEPISEDTIRRMYSYLSRHKGDLDSSKSYDDGCGKLMYDSWGGLTALSWSESKINAIDKEKMSSQKFQTDDEKRIVVGPAMIPDLKIFRKDESGKPYYVYFSSDTIKMIAEKYMRYKYIDNNDTNHNGEAAKDVYVVESWIKEDSQDKSNKYGYEDLPVGTWFVSMKVRNDEIWDKVKSGELNGFSVSGYFEEIRQFSIEREFLSQVAQILKKYK